jgi:hypothetical protein
MALRTQLAAHGAGGVGLNDALERFALGIDGFKLVGGHGD